MARKDPPVTTTMASRVRLALDLAGPGTVPARFENAYRRGGTPTSVHLTAIASAAGTTPMWLMTGRTADPTHHAPEDPPVTNPSGCRWCGVDQPEHMQRWKPQIGWHKWEQPTQQQIKERMLARRTERTSP